MLHADWHPPCVHFAPAFARMSLARSSPSLRFASLDLGRWRGLAKRYDVDMAAVAAQLPTLLLLQGGCEVARIPRKAAGGKGVARGQWKVQDVVHAFQLDERAEKGAAREERKKES